MKQEILEHYGNHIEIIMINNLIDDYLKDKKFDMEFNEYKKQRVYYNRDIYKDKYKNNNICVARIWNNLRGGRCSFKINPYDDIQYPIERYLCRKHCNVVRKSGGVLQFDTYENPLPNKNLVTGCKLGWH